MRLYSAVDMSGYSRFNPGPGAPLWWGIIGLILIESTVVAAFVASYFYLRMGAEAWPPPGVAAPDLLLPTVNLVLLLASGVTMWGAGKAMNKDRHVLFTVLCGASLLLAGAVLILRWDQFRQFEFRWDSHPYGSIVWTITGFHFMHVVSAVIGTGVVFVLSFWKYFNSERQLAVVVDTMYWYFVCAAWIPFYLVLYWAPRLT